MKTNARPDSMPRCTGCGYKPGWTRIIRLRPGTPILCEGCSLTRRQAAGV